ncbi:MAG: 6,7-dimethyl-8-ribityllumazine synthase [SAR324 cluster bacterium]|jgi:6,7-dimethyl-8-ribityllumazine synthase|nr:6,7-dimethyl-8-ribityllumazine synthase [Deltaproteobacteria bacterium]MDP6090858.1 6,7-dimethyl-8-ribityllumazine synthase [SAR324 cluster bacterium]MBI12561.1 6,7-dimethyl-8-ribityllumazine synthase [Deltaproteobacteria bacterium]MBP42978.1 6,7-dimethyl-8-ribityllumazine synthase [Deltaproteobacteria bacterium]MDP6248552.1 6,7-dimethyl-8-ribityllumazine synthase [SAR324 cluster bacterium]|tara:strand:+ start:451 stop:912 length:462 start_codon:yes stop_codon:yes gene_type:complete
MKEISGDLIAQGLKFAFVVARFNELIGERLLEGALDTFQRHGGNPDDVVVIRVPGAYEIPLAAKKIAGKGLYDAVICLGAVIRGETPHFDYVAANAASGISTVSLESGIPISFGILTTDTIEQAIERSGTKSGNQGRNATLTAIEMASLLGKI